MILWWSVNFLVFWTWTTKLVPQKGSVEVHNCSGSPLKKKLSIFVNPTTGNTLDANNPPSGIWDTKIENVWDVWLSKTWLFSSLFWISVSASSLPMGNKQNICVWKGVEEKYTYVVLMARGQNDHELVNNQLSCQLEGEHRRNVSYIILCPQQQRKTTWYDYHGT